MNLVNGRNTNNRIIGSDSFVDILYNEPGDWDVVEAVKGVASKRGIAPAQIALAWLLSKSAVTAPIVGATKMQHLEDAIASVDLELTDEEIALLEAPYKPHAVKGMFG
ncbi:MAG: aldo/keto reductase [Candidatus Hydrogenedentes bacterium]|nr:aldo/keto reductase [Candidatus Hydrogenedentota bacterium]